MNSYLAELYNTNGYAEKVAQVEENVAIFMKVAEEEGVDLSDLSEDEIVELAQEYAEDGDEEYFDSDSVEGPDNMGPKTAEADFLGRVMAHSYNNELNGIEMQKQSSGKDGVFRRAGKWVGDKLQQVGSKSFSDRGRAKMEAKRWLESGKRSTGLSKGETFGRRASDPRGTTQTRGMARSNIKKDVAARIRKSEQLRGGAVVGGTGLAGAGVLGGAYSLGKSNKEKKSHIEMIDELAVERANEWLEATEDGYSFTLDKLSSVSEDDLDQVITELAWSKLQDAGYIK